MRSTCSAGAARFGMLVDVSVSSNVARLGVPCATGGGAAGVAVAGATGAGVEGCAGAGAGVGLGAPRSLSEIAMLRYSESALNRDSSSVMIGDGVSGGRKSNVIRCLFGSSGCTLTSSIRNRLGVPPLSSTRARNRESSTRMC